jgi:hypothetical protein
MLFDRSQSQSFFESFRGVLTIFGNLMAQVPSRLKWNDTKKKYKNVIVTIFTFLTGAVCTTPRRGTKADQLVLHIVCCYWKCHRTWTVSPGTEN